MLFLHSGFHIVGRGGKTLGSQPTGAVVGDEHVVLDADAAEVIVTLQFGVIHKVTALPFNNNTLILILFYVLL